MPFLVEIVIPDSLGPNERGELYDLPLCDIFDELGDGNVVAGGTRVTFGGIESCEVVFETSDVGRIMPLILKLLEKSNAPPGTIVRQLEPVQVDLHVIS